MISIEIFLSTNYDQYRNLVSSNYDQYRNLVRTGDDQYRNLVSTIHSGLLKCHVIEFHIVLQHLDYTSITFSTQSMKSFEFCKTFTNTRNIIYN